LWITAGAVGIVLSLAVTFFLNPTVPTEGSHAYTFTYTRKFASLEQGSAGLPVRLEIPKINVDAAIEPVGLTSQGAVDVPKDPTDAAWFSLSPRPGASGSSVIDGHIGWWKDGAAAVFNSLYKLRKGDRLYTVDGQGVTTTFVVRGSRKYNPNANASGVFDSADGKVHLNLITCDGTWNSTQKNYPDRLVVFTDEETK
jgi:LPXTG-site transpeptidase (sortase) family protein